MKAQHLANILFFIAGWVWVIDIIPQICKTLKLKSSEDISLPFFVLCIFAYALFLTGALLIRNWAIFIPHMVSFILSFYMIYLILKYRNKK